MRVFIILIWKRWTFCVLFMRNSSENRLDDVGFMPVGSGHNFFHQGGKVRLRDKRPGRVSERLRVKCLVFRDFNAYASCFIESVSFSFQTNSLGLVSQWDHSSSQPARFPSAASTAAQPQTAPPFRSAVSGSPSPRMSIT